MNELYHYGVPGMKWGVRKTDAQYRERSKIRKKSKIFGDNRKAVKEARDKIVKKQGTFKRLREKAVYSGKEKDFRRFKDYEDKLVKEWKSKDFDAWMKDSRIKELSDDGRKFAERCLYGPLGYSIDTVLYD